MPGLWTTDVAFDIKHYSEVPVLVRDTPSRLSGSGLPGETSPPDQVQQAVTAQLQLELEARTALRRATPARISSFDKVQRVRNAHSRTDLP